MLAERNSGACPVADAEHLHTITLPPHSSTCLPTDVKATGAWTKALHKQDSDGLLVNVDGFYSSVHNFMSMKTSGYSRLVFFAGGSGMTSFLAFIQVKEMSWRLSIGCQEAFAILEQR